MNLTTKIAMFRARTRLEGTETTVKSLKPDDVGKSRPNIVGRVQVGKHVFQVALSPNGLISVNLVKGSKRTAPSNTLATKAFKEAWKKSQYYGVYKDYARFEGTESDDEVQGLTEKVGTELIQRALRGLGSGAGEVQVAKALQQSGVTKEDAFLAIKAAKILLGDMMKEGRPDQLSQPLPPLHRWPVHIEKKGKVSYTLKDLKVVETAEPPGSGLYEYELFFKGNLAGKFNNQREVIARAQALRVKG